MYTCSTNGCNLYHTALNVRVLRCGRDRHLHGQVFVVRRPCYIFFCSYLDMAVTRRYTTFTFECCNSANTSQSRNCPYKYGVVTICGYGLTTLDEIGFFGRACSGIFVLLRAGGYQLVHGPGSKRSWSTAVTFMLKPWSLSGLSLCVCPASLSDVFLTGATC